LAQEVRSCHHLCAFLNHTLVHSLDASQALLVVKTLGKNPSGSAVIASAVNLSTLLGLTSSFNNDSEASSEALRCVANALLLVADARSTWLQEEVGGGHACVNLLDVRLQ